MLDFKYYGKILYKNCLCKYEEGNATRLLDLKNTHSEFWWVTLNLNITAYKQKTIIT